jgi:uncharacterized protein (TIGR03067 family)
MFRLAMLCGSILAATCAAQDKKEVPKDLMPFQGTWKLVKLEEGGKEPASGLPDEVRFIFTGNKLSFKEGKNASQEGTYSVDPKKDPSEIDLISPKNEKRLGIFKFDKDGKLTVTYINKPNAMRPKKFSETETIMIVLEKVKE